MTFDGKIDYFLSLGRDAVRKLETLAALRKRGLDLDPEFRQQWQIMERTMKVIDHKVQALTSATKPSLQKPTLDRTLDRAIKAAELLNLELDDLLSVAEENK